MRPYQDLVVWQKAHALVLEVYRVTELYPREERYGLSAQSRSVASSVPANIAEGCGKRTLAQLRHSVDTAAGSLSELEYWLLLARDLGHPPQDIHQQREAELSEVRRLLLGFASWSTPGPGRRGGPAAGT